MKILSTKHNRIPTALGLLFLVIFTVVGVYVTSQPTSFFSKASQSCSPVNVQITNLTYKSFDISFITSKECQITASVNSQIYNDARNLDQGKTHYYRIINLSPKTEYQYKFLSEGDEFTNSSYKVTTFSKPNQAQPDSALSWGRVFFEENTPATNSIVYINIPDLYPLSSFVTNQAYFDIPLINSYSINSNQWIEPPNNTADEIIVMSPEGQTIVLVNSSLSRNPIPDIIFNQQKFSQTTGKIEYDKAISTTAPTYEFVITNPTDGESINSQTPQFFGQGPAGISVDIEVNSETKIKDSFKVTSSGTWSYTVPNNLEPGEHSLNIKYTDPITGTIKTITRKFTVLAASNNDGPAFTSSGSATLKTPTPTKTPIPTNIPTSIPTLTPTNIPTTAPTLKPTTPPTATPTLVVTANIIPTLGLFAFAFLLVISSIIFLSY